MYWILFIGIAIISYIVQASLQSKFEKYSRMALDNGMTGREVAEKMLRDNGIYDVTVTSTPGMLTDHYNPTNKTVNLSEGVYNTCSVADAFGFGTGSAILLFHCIVGIIGRNSYG